MMKRLFQEEHYLFIVLAHPCFSVQDILKIACCTKQLNNILKSEAAITLWALRANTFSCRVCVSRNYRAIDDFVGNCSSLCAYYRGVCCREEAARRLRAKWGIQFASRSLVNTSNEESDFSVTSLAFNTNIPTNDEVKFESPIRSKKTISEGLALQIHSQSLIDSFLVMESSALLAGGSKVQHWHAPIRRR